MELSDFKNIHNGKKILILGLGQSLNQYSKEVYDKYITIGVNDIGRTGIIPTYLVFLNEFMDFCQREKDNMGMDDIANSIINSEAKYIFVYAYDKVKQRFHPEKRHKLIDIHDTRQYDSKFYNRDMLAHCYTSPFVAITLAIYMGASSIGIIGMDFCGDHAFGNVSDQWKNGKKSIFYYMPRIENGLIDLQIQCPDIRFYNLSKCSTLLAFDKITLEEFDKI